MTLDRAALLHNIDLFHGHLAERGVHLAPHAKTTMCPRIWAAQLEAGAWALTVANVTQLEVCAHYRVPRVLIANEVASSYDVRRLATIASESSWMEIMCLVDSVAAVELLSEAMTEFCPGRRLDVLVELGMRGGRAGARTLEDLMTVTHAVTNASSTLRLVGIEGYEGIISPRRGSEPQETVDAYLSTWVAAADRVLELVEPGAPRIVSSGGSIWFDRVIEAFARVTSDCELVIRSGGYVTHDSLLFDAGSPLGSTSVSDENDMLRAALSVTAAVLSRPEPRLAIIGAGGRDLPTDAGYPVVLSITDRSGVNRPLPEVTVIKVNDQHLYLEVPADMALHPGDLVRLGISHPCTAFDRWRIILETDSDGKVLDAVETYF
jgi:D-serine deaminase-like pyridoxal phosphate-dependent protein